jgi:hypothetical protein
LRGRAARLGGRSLSGRNSGRSRSSPGSTWGPRGRRVNLSRRFARVRRRGGLAEPHVFDRRYHLAPLPLCLRQSLRASHSGTGGSYATPSFFLVPSGLGVGRRFPCLRSPLGCDIFATQKSPQLQRVRQGGELTDKTSAAARTGRTSRKTKRRGGSRPGAMPYRSRQVDESPRDGQQARVECIGLPD